ncbi:MAG: translation initiation factor IF-3 [Bacteroidales bacterium]|nr:translation initiation factor IF-3 [Bacteroidales bacterium]
MAKNQNKKDSIREPRVNGAITGSQTIRVVYKKNTNGENSDEDFVKVMSLWDARRLAEKMGLDLVEVSPSANPPVVKLCDYSKYLYELKKAEKNKNKNTTKLKEISITANISEHDMQTKAKKVMEFIEDGDKVKVSLFLKGREVARRDELKKTLYVFIGMVEEVAVPEALPNDEGNRSIVILKPKKK